jgi:hypothetical protein
MWCGDLRFQLPRRFPGGNVKVVNANQKLLPRGTFIAVRGQVQMMRSSYLGLLLGLGLAVPSGRDDGIGDGDRHGPDGPWVAEFPPAETRIQPSKTDSLTFVVK